MRRILFFCLGAVLGLAACSDDDDRALSFDSSVYHVPVYTDRAVAIASGNGDYTITSEDEAVVLAGFATSGKKMAGDLILTGKSVGQTWVNVTDKATGETVRLKVYVTQSYFTISVNTPQAVISPDDAENYTEAADVVYSRYPFTSEYVNFYLLLDGSLVVDERPARDDPGYTGTYRVEHNDAGNYGVEFTFTKAEKEVVRFYQVTGRGGYEAFVKYFFESFASDGSRAEQIDTNIVLTEDVIDYLHEVDDAREPGKDRLFDDIKSARLRLSGKGSDSLLMKDSLFE